jgi:hypothetical protein
MDATFRVLGPAGRSRTAATPDGGRPARCRAGTPSPRRPRWRGTGHTPQLSDDAPSPSSGTIAVLPGDGACTADHAGRRGMSPTGLCLIHTGEANVNTDLLPTRSLRAVLVPRSRVRVLGRADRTLTVIRENEEKQPDNTSLIRLTTGPGSMLVAESSGGIDCDHIGRQILRRNVFRSSSVNPRWGHLPETTDREIRTLRLPSAMSIGADGIVTDPKTLEIVCVAVCGAHLQRPETRPPLIDGRWYVCRECRDLYLRLLHNFPEWSTALHFLATAPVLAAA